MICVDVLSLTTRPSGNKVDIYSILTITQYLGTQPGGGGGSWGVAARGDKRSYCHYHQRCVVIIVIITIVIF